MGDIWTARGRWETYGQLGRRGSWETYGQLGVGGRHMDS